MTSYRVKPPQPWPGVLDAVPAEFDECMREPAFVVSDVTFCIWRRYVDSSWQIGPIIFPPTDPDGSEFLLCELDGFAETYRLYAEKYYEREVELAAVEHVYQHLPLTPNLIARLNPEVSLSELAADIQEICYPQ